MSVSVIMPSYNGAAVIGEAIESALHQTAPPQEIIVIDDGSTDDTRSRIAGYGPKVRYVHQNNQGVAAARNRGLHEARCEFVAFLDSDDVWHPNKLERQLQALSQAPRLGLLGTDFIHWPQQRFSAPAGAPSVQRVSFEQMVVRNYFGTSSIIARRQALDLAGEFDPRLQGPEDYDLWLRVSRVAEVGNVKEQLTGYRDSPGSLSKHPLRMQAGMRLILEKLESAGTFRNRRWLRRKAYSHFHYCCGLTHHIAGNEREAFGNLFRSLMYYPFFYGRGVLQCRFARLRLFRRTLFSLLTGAARSGKNQAESANEPHCNGSQCGAVGNVR